MSQGPVVAAAAGVVVAGETAMAPVSKMLSAAGRTRLGLGRVVVMSRSTALWIWFVYLGIRAYRPQSLQVWLSWLFWFTALHVHWMTGAPAAVETPFTSTHLPLLRATSWKSCGSLPL